jgi:hypothetical protein
MPTNSGLIPFRPASPSHGGRTAKSAGGPRCDAPICSDAPLHFSLLPFHHNSKLCVGKEAFLVALRSLADHSPQVLIRLKEGHHDCENNYRHGCGSDNGWLSLRG